MGDQVLERSSLVVIANLSYSKNYDSNTVWQIQDLVHSFEEGDLSAKPTIINAYKGLRQATSKARLAIESKLQFRYVKKVPWSPNFKGTET